MLDLNLILSLSQACAPQVAPETLAAIAYTESRFNPIAIGVNRGPRPDRAPRDAAEAARVARALLARGANLDLGVAQINSDNLDWLGLSVEAAFEPCSNLTAAAVVLATGYRPEGSTPKAQQVALRAALSRYNTGHPSRGFRNGYVARVERAALSLFGGPIRPMPAVEAPVRRVLVTAASPPPAWDVFGRAPLSAAVIFRTTTPSTAWSPTP